MKRFIDSIINILINIITIAFILGLFFVVIIFILSKSNDIELSDTISYMKTFGNEFSSVNIKNSTPINVYSSRNYEPNNIKVSSTNNKFYYKQLDYNSKLIYDALEDNIHNLKEDNYIINFSTTFNDLLHEANGQYLLNIAFQTAIDAFFYDHPELFYIDLTKISLRIESITLGPITKYKVSLEPMDGFNYLHTNFSSKEDVDNAILMVDSIRNTIINNLSDFDDYTKVLKVHNTLVNSIKYDSSSTNIRNIYGALIEKKVVCEGYAKAFKYILDALNIECILISGTATNSNNDTESHMWNYVDLDGNWYGVDVTWDDPIIIGNPNKNSIRHDYFCKGSNVFNESHVINNKLSDEGKAFSIPTLSYKNYK